MREVQSQLQSLLGSNPGLAGPYQSAREVIRIFRKAAFYEISQRCNLFCEGCYYFENEAVARATEIRDPKKWDDFFAAEARRHVSLAYFVGAEPALEQKRLHAAARHLPYGILGTNGTIKIDRDIPFRIQVSIWAADDSSEVRLRGAPAYRKAFKNYEGDPRANMVFTLSAWNLDVARSVATLCRDHGILLTFNHYSPTHSFLKKLGAGVENDSQYFRLSSAGATPCLEGDSLRRARDTVDELMDDFPETIVYSRAINRRATQPGQIYEVDPISGIAEKCGSRIVGNMRYFKADLKSEPVKCCTPDVNCRECRMYSGLWSTSLMPTAADVATADTFSDWIDVIRTLGKVFIYHEGSTKQEDKRRIDATPSARPLHPEAYINSQPRPIPTIQTQSFR